VAKDGSRVPVPPLIVDTEDARRVCQEAHARREQRLRRKAQIGESELRT
jgi:hypothetical protein